MIPLAERNNTIKVHLCMHVVYLSLGTNLGEKLKNLQEAIDFINKRVGKTIQQSSVYKSESWGFKAPDFLNQVIMIKTESSPQELLHQLKSIEKELGRKPVSVKKYESRLIDIDIVFFNNLVINEKTIVIPHPKMQLRRFVLMPLNEIAKNHIHPITNKTVNRLLINCKDECKTEKYTH